MQELITKDITRVLKCIVNVAFSTGKSASITVYCFYRCAGYHANSLLEWIFNMSNSQEQEQWSISENGMKTIFQHTPHKWGNVCIEIQAWTLHFSIAANICQLNKINEKTIMQKSLYLQFCSIWLSENNVLSTRKNYLSKDRQDKTQIKHSDSQILHCKPDITGSSRHASTKQ